jgi:hypothetical protein
MYHLYSIWVKPKYNIKFVKAINESCKKFLNEPFIHYCLTDQPEKFINTDIIPIDVRPYDLEGWWFKFLFFKPNFCEIGAKCIFFDLDSKILKPLEPMLQFNDKLILAHNPTKIIYNSLVNKSIRKKSLGRYYTVLNSSVMMWIGGNHYDLYEKFMTDPDKYMIEYYGNDEFITYEYPDGYDLIDAKWIYHSKSLTRSILCMKMSDSDMLKLMSEL